MGALSGITVRNRALFFDGILVIADLHVGRGETSNVQLPVGDGTEMVERFGGLCRRFEPHTVVIAGDLLHSFQTVPGPVRETIQGIKTVVDDVGAQVVVTPGNHDTLLDAVWSGPTEAEFRHADTVVCHGHVEPATEADRYLVGHDHPTIEIEGQRHTCFLAGDGVYNGADVLMFPSFNQLVPGVTVNGMSGADFMSPLVETAGELRPIVWDDETDAALEFPPLGEFRHQL